ncbi:SAM-dependent methyltransferase [Anoxybacillus caldiproteolyticus]|nr:TrmO family methyltransferase [Anoxybacillus caldiproteolyticus]QPA30390.1 SAM-dependent methyltransferase [Anoxybacillus caldiproteolyticus]
MLDDDYWGSVVSEFTLIDELNATALDGIEDFSHLESIFYFDKVSDEKIQYGTKHPQNNQQYPKVGIFAQRGKNRPNKLGATSVEFIKRNGKTLIVKGVDDIDGTPVTDIKPVMRKFLPLTGVKQPL